MSKFLKALRGAGDVAEIIVGASIVIKLVDEVIRELSGRCFISLKKVLFLIKVIPNFAYALK